jgi:uncharacterized membrane protein (DUF485 family)
VSDRPGVLALILFTAYLAAYSAFVIIAAFFTFSGGKATGGLAARSADGVPLGVMAGLGLIVGAFALALIYAAFGPRARAEHGPAASGEPSAKEPRS